MTDRASRRSVLLGAAGLGAASVVGIGAGVERGVLPGRPAAQRLLGLNGEAGVVPDVAAGPVERGTLASRHRPGETRWAIARPPGDTTDLPVVVALHGLGQDVDSLMGGSLGLPEFLAAAVARGTAPFTIAAVDGGRSYWHPHGGEDAGAVVVDDLLPLLAQRGLVTDRVGLMGWSMGGYGALLLGGLLGADRVAAVCAVSPALWLDPDDASPSGFSDAAEYRAYSVLGHQDDLAGVPVRVDCGTGDPFYRAVRRYADGLDASARSHFTPGAHSPAYWRRVLPAQLAWLGARLQDGAE